ncbi:6-phospho-3-hexuloisomerase [Burkholderia sp. Ac-20365]|jgi:6-phospho-3-hexuloisomerase|uniref:6-phospho-3-hexuloisomerase n=1 Tax=Burkholderia sp. Ac-20365 TaxID=2703897 RepID=UPI00197C66F1|nr:6-phospho-3-hexuloisomerase [Burkholderia sp. Ac-20365]MBN3765253.1 SIS domain-containing protein [Burkholderia sp. Ac-20365]
MTDLKQLELPSLTRDILGEIEASLRQVNAADLDALVAEIERAPKVFCLGAGRSGILLQAFCMRLNHLGVEAYMAGGLPCPPVGASDLIIVASGSGETRSVSAVLEQGRQAGARVALFTARRSGARSMDADVTVVIPAPSGLVNREHPQNLQPMRTLFEQGFFLLCEAIVCWLKLKKGIGEEEMAQRHANLE